MIDPSTADVTARVLECLGRFGWPAGHPVVQKAVGFLTNDQSKDGSWFGPLGRELRVRDERRVAGVGDGFVDGAGLLRAGGCLAAAGGRKRTEVWRVAAEL